MGKKKSMVFLMFILTIVIAVLCAITVFPTFKVGKIFKDSVKIWNPAVMQYDFGADLGGGYYAYYYPEGVIPAAEYYEALEGKTGEDKTEYENSYVPHKGLFLNVDDKYGLCDNDGAVLEDFKTEFNRFVKEVTARYNAKNYSDCRIAVVDDYALLVELPASDQDVATTLSLMSYTGALTLQVGGEVIDVLDSKDADIRDYVESFGVKVQYDVAYLKVKLTKAGEKALASVKSTLSSAEDAQSSTDSSSLTSLTLMVGDQQVGYPVFKEYIEDRTIMIPEADKSGVATVETFAALLNSVLENGEFDLQFSAIDTTEIRVIEPVYGENVVTLLYIALAIVLVLVIAIPIVFQGRFGVVNAYTVVSYLIIAGLCFAFISKSVFEITLGSVLIFLLGLVLIALLNTRMYNAVKKEFYLGKTVESAVKTGYKKSLFGMVDIYVVLVLGALAALIGIAGLHTLALQALICFIAAAFCNLLWTFAINFVFLGASKDKVKYFRFVREDDDDE